MSHCFSGDRRLSSCSSLITTSPTAVCFCHLTAYTYHKQLIAQTLDDFKPGALEYICAPWHHNTSQSPILQETTPLWNPSSSPLSGPFGNFLQISDLQNLTWFPVSHISYGTASMGVGCESASAGPGANEQLTDPGSHGWTWTSFVFILEASHDAFLYCYLRYFKFNHF